MVFIAVLGAGALLLVETLRARFHAATPSMALLEPSLELGPPLGPSGLAQRSTAATAGAGPNPCDDIYGFICQKSGEIQDITGVVHSDLEGERQAIQLYKNLLRDHKEWTIQQIDDELVRQIYNPKRRGRIERAFQWVKESVDGFIIRQPESVFNDQEKAEIRSRLAKTHLEIPPPASIYADEPDLLTRNEVYYERLYNGKMRLRAGGAYLLIAKSWFNLIFTFAHELAHSIDPCEIRSAGYSFPSYDHLTACFLQKNFIRMSKNRAECGANDQLSEIFADWVGVHVTAEALLYFATEFQGPQIANAAKNSVRDLCEQDDDPSELDLEFHPSPRIRIEKIFGQNPQIRQLFGCEAPLGLDTLNYCNFDFNPKETFETNL